jgi:hypothetical protein
MGLRQNYPQAKVSLRMGVDKYLAQYHGGEQIVFSDA